MGAPKILPDDNHESLGFRVRIVSRGEAFGQVLARELEESLNGWIQLEVGSASSLDSRGLKGPAQVYFVDAATPDLDAQIAQLDRSEGQMVFIILRETDNVPAALVEGRVDDVLVYPFRSLEVLSKLRLYQKQQAHHEALELNASYTELVQKLQEDLKLAERLQKQRLPRRFPEVKGFKVTSRYLAGERSGGDYVDMADTRDGHSLAIIMTDASTYRLSSAVLDTISRRMGNIPADEVRSCVTAARRIRDGVLMTLGERDHLSLFYAVLSRKDYRLKFLNLGSTRVFYAPPGKPFEETKAGHGDPIVKAVSVRTDQEGELALEPDGRLVLVSDGFAESAGGASELIRVLNLHRAGDAADALNELVFRTKKPLTGPEDLPAQDCTALIFDVDSRLIRLA